MHISLLGPIRLTTGADEIALPKSRKVRALLAYLALSTDPPSRETLCQLLFPNANDPRASLRWALNQLRQVLPVGAITNAGDRLALSREQLTCDVDQLRRFGDVPGDYTPMAWRAAAKFEQGIRGHLMDGLTVNESPEFEAWHMAQEGAADRRHRAVLQKLIAGCDHPSDRIGFAERLVEIEPLIEASWTNLIRILDGAGELARAHKTRDLAAAQLAQNGFASDDVTRPASVGDAEQPDQLASSKHRETLAVATTTILDSHDALTPIAHAVDEALFAAVNANRSCAVLSRSLTTAHLSSDLLLHRNDGRLRPDLLLEAQLSPHADVIRLQMELVYVADGTCLFNWEYDIDQQDPRVIAEALTALYSARFEIDLQLALIKLAHMKSTSARTWWDKYYLALPRIYSAEGHDPEESLRLLEDVIEMEPSVGSAAAIAAWVRTTHPQFNQHPADIAITASFARRAVELCQDDTFAMGIASIVIASTERDLDTARNIIVRARTFNPYSTMGLIAIGVVEHYAGDHTLAFEYLDTAERATDTEPLTFAIQAFKAMCHYMQGEPEKCLRLAKAACGRNPRFVVARRALTACLAAMGESKAAQIEAERLQALDPSEYLSFYREHNPYRRDEDIRRLVSDLEIAGLSDAPPELV